MSMSDPIADLLTRIRNACMVKHRTVDMPTSRMKTDILAVLKNEGYINGYQAVEGAQSPTTRVFIRYHKHEPVLQHLRRISTPGLRRYVKSKDIKPVRGGLGVAVLSTPEGVITDREARKKNVGGELLLEIW
jgi:small subunit ribosomal protein S8